MTRTNVDLNNLAALTERQFYGRQFENNGFFQRSVDGATKAAEQVWAEVLPNVEAPLKDPERPYLKSNNFDATPFEDLKVGDLVAYAEETPDSKWNSVRFRFREDYTVAGWVGSYSKPHLAVVTKRTAKRVTVVGVDNPAAYYAYDFDLTVADEGGYRRYEETFGDSFKRFMLVLGNVEEVRAAVKAAPSYAKWEKAQVASAACETEHERRRQVEEDARKAEADKGYAVSKPVAKTLNEALGFKVFRAHEDGTVTRRESYTEDVWANVPTEALRMLLAGRVATGYVTETEGEAALALLKVTAVVDGEMN